MHEQMIKASISTSDQMLESGIRSAHAQNQLEYIQGYTRCLTSRLIRISGQVAYPENGDGAYTVR